MASGGASRVSARRAAQNTSFIPTTAAAIVAMAGICEMGFIGRVNTDDRTPFLSWADYQRVCGGFTQNSRNLDLAVRSFWDEVGDNSGAQLFISRIVHCTTLGDPTSKTSAAGTLNLPTASFSATSGYVLGSVVGPYNLPSTGLTLVISRDALGNATATINATAAARESASGNFVMSDGMTFSFKIDGGATFTKTFEDTEFTDVGAATPVEVVASLNAYFLSNGIGALASVTNTDKVTITSIRKGTGSGVNVTGGTANAVFTFTTGNVAGTGNVSNLAAVTVAEIKTIVEGAVSGVTVTNVGGAAQITSNITGVLSLVQVISTSTADTYLGFDNTSHTGLAGSPEDTVQLDAIYDGAYINAFTAKVMAATSGDATRKNLLLLRDGVEVERWENTNLVTGDPLNLITLINKGGGGQKKSRYVRATSIGTLAAPYNLPATGTVGPFTGGDNGLTSISDADFYGASTEPGATGLRCFDKVPRIDDIAIPGRCTASAQNQLITYISTSRGGRTFAVLGSAEGQNVAAVRTYVTSTAALKGLSEIARFVFPWVYVDNPAPGIFGSDPTILAPPEGAVLGMHARISGSGPGAAFEQPAGQELGFLRSVRGVETMEGEDFGKRGLLQDDNINVIRSQDGVPHFVDGSDTLNSEGVFPTCGESRGVNFVINSLVRSGEGPRQRNINEALYSRYTNSAERFLEVLTDAGRFRSRIYKYAFFVDYGRGLNPDSAVEAQEVNGRLGLNTSPSAKFINIEIVPFRPAASA